MYEIRRTLQAPAITKMCFLEFPDCESSEYYPGFSGCGVFRGGSVSVPQGDIIKSSHPGRKRGSFVLVYQENSGHYRGAVEMLANIGRSLYQEHFVQTSKASGIYYDDPQEEESSRMRSIAGRVLE